MRETVDLLICPGGGQVGGLQVFLSGPGHQEAFTVPASVSLQEMQRLWRQRFLRHHDPAFAWPDGGAVVRSYSERLRLELDQWLQEPCWQPLQQLLRNFPDSPLRLQLQGVDTAMANLPWERLSLRRPIWRTQVTIPIRATQRPVRARQPRVLLVVGSEQGLALESEIARLEQHHRRGRIRLTLLRGTACSPAALRQTLVQPSGWDAVLYLGHSSDGPVGGFLHLGDGSQINGQSLEHEWTAAAANGLQLLLLNSCSGLQLASSAVRQGVGWAVCFLEPVPAAAAALAFGQLLEALQSGLDLQGAIQQTRQTLDQRDGVEGCGLLLAAVGTFTARPYRLPLRRRRQFMVRLASSRRKQAIAAAIVVSIAAAMELKPENPINTYLLDRRLLVQRLWRRATDQRGPQPSRSQPPIPVLLLDQDTTIPALGVRPAADHTSRYALAEVLRRTPAQQVPVVGLDFLLIHDRPGTRDLASVIRGQPSRRVVGGYSARGGDADQIPMADSWLKNSPLTKAGLQPKDVSVGSSAGDGTIKPVPLHLLYAITARNFAGSLSQRQQPLLPADRVLDWSMDWSGWIRLMQPADLPALRAPVLLVGSSGVLGDRSVDLFAAPAAVQNPLLSGEQPLWVGNIELIPGVLVQAVLIQSLNLGHWLTPASQTLCTLATAGLGVLLAALIEGRRRRLIVLALIISTSCPLAWSLAIWQQWLVPLMLPLLALSGTMFNRP